MHCCAVVVNTSTEKPLKSIIIKIFLEKKKTITTHFHSDCNFGFQRENLCDPLMINMALTGKALS